MDFPGAKFGDVIMRSADTHTHTHTQTPMIAILTRLSE